MKFYIKKQNGRYEEYGDQWEGFPADGWWFVGDGRRNLVVPIDAPRPLRKLQFQQYRERILDALYESKDYADGISKHDLIKFVLDELEKITDNE